jgi:hypothetical protein
VKNKSEISAQRIALKLKPEKSPNGKIKKPGERLIKPTP